MFCGLKSKMSGQPAWFPLRLYRETILLFSRAWYCLMTLSQLYLWWSTKTVRQSIWTVETLYIDTVIHYQNLTSNHYGRWDIWGQVTIILGNWWRSPLCFLDVTFLLCSQESEVTRLFLSMSFIGRTLIPLADWSLHNQLPSEGHSF